MGNMPCVPSREQLSSVPPTAQQVSEYDEGPAVILEGVDGGEGGAQHAVLVTSGGAEGGEDQAELKVLNDGKSTWEEVRTVDIYVKVCSN
jgi:hypothetical protein